MCVCVFLFVCFFFVFFFVFFWSDKLFLVNYVSPLALIEIFKNSPNGLNDQKGSENINCTRAKYGETFYGRHTALTPAVVKRIY